MKKLCIFILTFFSCVAMSASEHPFAGLSVADYRITSVMPVSFSELTGKAVVTLNNTGTRRVVTDIRADVYRNGMPFVSGVCSDITLLPGTNKYTLNGKVALSDDVSLFSAILAALSFNPSEYEVKVTLVMTHESGEVETITRKVPVDRYLK